MVTLYKSMRRNAINVCNKYRYVHAKPNNKLFDTLHDCAFMYMIHEMVGVKKVCGVYLRLEAMLSHAAPIIALVVLIMAPLTTCAVPDVVPRYVPLTKPS